MIHVGIRAGDTIEFDRVRYTMRQLLTVAGHPFCMHRLEQDALVGPRPVIVCVPQRDAHQFQGEEIDLVIPYGDYQAWRDGADKIRSTNIDGIPVLYVQQPPDCLWCGRSVGFDLISPAFFLLSCEDERLYRHRDHHGRFAASYSLLAELGLLHQPVVSLYSRLLTKRLSSVLNRPAEAKWKGGAKYCVVLSHDVDHLPREDVIVPLRDMWGLLWRGHPSRAVRLWRSLKETLIALGRRAARWKLADWTSLERDLGVRSTFFLASNASARNSSDPPYRLSSKMLHDGRQRPLWTVAKSLEQDGWEIGLHGSYASCSDPVLLGKEKKRLVDCTGCSIRGIRQHYLRFDVERTWAIHDDLSFEYDTTLGYSERSGFRAGTAHPFNPYDAKNHREYELVELPMAIMESSLLGDPGENLDAPKAVRRCERLLDAVAETEGVLVVNFHPHYPADVPAAWQVYQQLLRRAAESSAWVTTCAEASRWWRQRKEQLQKCAV